MGTLCRGSVRRVFPHGAVLHVPHVGGVAKAYLPASEYGGAKVLPKGTAGAARTVRVVVASVDEATE